MQWCVALIKPSIRLAMNEWSWSSSLDGVSVQGGLLDKRSSLGVIIRSNSDKKKNMRLIRNGNIQVFEHLKFWYKKEAVFSVQGRY